MANVGNKDHQRETCYNLMDELQLTFINNFFFFFLQITGFLLHAINYFFIFCILYYGQGPMRISKSLYEE